MEKPKQNLLKKVAKAKFLTPLKAIIMTALVFYLALAAYKYFGVTDIWGWLEDVMILLAVFLLVILAAAGVVALLALFRKNSGDFE